MLGRLLILVALVVLVWLALTWFVRTPPAKLARVLRKVLLYGGIGLLVLLVVTGRLPWLFALVGAAIPFIQRIMTMMRVVPLLKQVMGMSGSKAGAGGNAAGRTSTINTRFLRMSLDHDTGDMNGLVLQGRHEGRSLSELDIEQILDLLAQYRVEDSQSSAVLEAYLDRTFGDTWRDQFSGEQSEGTGGEGGAAGDQSQALTREEAFAVLGLEPGADESAIKEAHRRLMQKLHPDRGGSTYLAAKINKAKDLLLG